MSIDTAVTRRALIVAGAATAGAAALAACSGGSNGSSDDSAAGTSGSPTSDASTSAGASSAAPSTSAGSSGSAGSSAGSSGAASADAVATLAELKVGEPKTVDLPNGKKGLLTRTSQTAVVCFSTVCTHEGCTVKPDGKELACPCHGSVFKAATGEPISGPAPSALPKIDVKVVNGQVVAG